MDIIACKAYVIVVINIICQGAWSEALRPLLNIPFLKIVLLIV